MIRRSPSSTAAAAILLLAASMTASLVTAATGAPNWETATGTTSRHAHWPNLSPMSFLRPDIVGDSSAFTSLWNGNAGKQMGYTLPNVQVANGGPQLPPGQVHANPLITTNPAYPNSQIVFIATQQNNVYAVDATSGAVLNSANFGLPLNAAEIPNCGDIQGTVGITGTPMIDSATSTAYFFSKAYARGTTSGFTNTIYSLHAIDTYTLAERPNFPVTLEGLQADNQNVKYFVSSTALQRPGVLLMGGAVYGAFGSHCDGGNFTGWVMGFDATTGRKLSTFVTDARSTDGGQSGIWMAGSGIASDRNGRMFVVTGNGNKDLVTARDQNSPPLGLSQAIINIGVDPVTNATSAQQFFESYDYDSFNGGDRDFGSGGVALIEPSPLLPIDLLVAGGKTGHLIIADRNNLGGFRNGVGGGNNIFQDIPPADSTISLFSTVASLSGTGPDGNPVYYIYAIYSGQPIICYQFDPISKSFLLAGKTVPQSSLGWNGAASGFPGSPIVTSIGGDATTALVWYCDFFTGSLNVFKAIPDGQQLTLLRSIKFGNINTLQKFQRIAANDKNIFVVTGDGRIAKFGVNAVLPFQVNNTDFGTITLNQTVTQQINFTVLATATPLTIKTVILTDNFGNPLSATYFSIVSSPPTNVNLVVGSTVTVKVTFAPPAFDTYHARLVVTTNQGVASNGISDLTGACRPLEATLQLTPNTVQFGGFIVGTPASLYTGVRITNIGMKPLIINSISDPGAPFSVVNAPAAGTVVPANGGTLPIIVQIDPAVRNPSYTGNVTISTSGGVKDLVLTASVLNPPVLLIKSTTLSGALVNSTSLDFGSLPAAGLNTSLHLYISNIGESPMELTKCKPPVAQSNDIRLPNDTIIFETQVIPSGATIDVPVFFFAPVSPIVGIPPKTISTSFALNYYGNDANTPIYITFTGVQTFDLAPPFGGAWQYRGCFAEVPNGRWGNGPPNAPPSSTMTVENCIRACSNAGYSYSGLEYAQECFCGNALPTTGASTNCNMMCKGNATVICGGGSALSIFAKSSVIVPSASPSASPSPSPSPSSTTSASQSAITSSTTSALQSSTTSASQSSTASPSTSASASLPPTTSTTTSSSSSTTTTTSTSSPTSTLKYTSLGCLDDKPADIGGNKLVANNLGTNKDSTTGKDQGWSYDLCAAACKAKYAGTTSTVLYFGLEYSKECWCGNALRNTTSADTAATNCNLKCIYPGSTSLPCGGTLNGGSYINMFRLPLTTVLGLDSVTTASSPLPASTTAAATTTSTTAVTTTTTTTTTQTSGSASPPPLSVSTSTQTSTSSTTQTSTSASPSSTLNSGAVPPGWSSIGCIGDNVEPNTRTFMWRQNLPTGSLGFNYTGCAAACMTEPHVLQYYASKPITTLYIGLEYASECWCDVMFRNVTVSADKPLSDCSMDCKGDPGFKCGGGQRLTAFKYSAPV